MKNLKVSAKLLVSFLIVVALAAAIGGVGIFGMMRIADSGTDMYESATEPMPNLAGAERTLLTIRIHVREMVIASMESDAALVEEEFGHIGRLLPVLDGYMDAYRASVQNPEAIRLFDEARALYENSLVPVVLSIYEASQVSDIPAVHSAMVLCRQYSDRILENFEQCFEIMVREVDTASQDAESLARILLIAIVVVLVAALGISLFLAFYVAGLIGKPLGVFTDFMTIAGTVGDLTLRQEDIDTIQEVTQYKDEMGQAIAGAAGFVKRVIGVSETLGQIADGDLSLDVALLSERDTLGLSMAKMLSSLNEMFGEINSSTGQVSSGSQQIADGSQILAQGSTEQASAIQELSSSISEIADKTKANAEKASQAAILATTIKGNAEKGSEQMDGMMSAVGEINAASQSISKVIKTIDDIAFQTNILALNAAVEAARAGQHGKGFAVVAEEVRNLAGKSAEAAKETGVLIQNSVEKAELGAKIAGETAASLTEIVSGINDSSVLIGDIAKSSEEQSAGITQINTGIDQVAQVVQQNSATAEESAAAAEEMSSQSNILEELVARFKLKDAARRIPAATATAAAPQKQLAMPEKPAPAPANGGFGKY